MSSSRIRWVRATALVGAGALLVAACGGGDGDSGASSSSSSSTSQSTEKVTLRVAYFGDFGLKQLKPIYEKEHPNVTLKLEEGDFNKQHENLTKFLLAGSGAPDVAAIDESFIVQFRNQSDKFVNLLEKGAADREKDYIPWKWKQSMSADGSVQIGLGTDVGGQAMCYRKDLFEKAGLPTDRDELSARWGESWDDFIEVGKEYVKGSGGKKFVDSAVNIFNPVLAQQPVGYFDTDDQLQMDGGPKVAWDLAAKTIEAGISANLAAWSNEWNAAFANGQFAVLACPAWMQGHIQTNAPSTSGKWDIADIPGDGGNWGGSFWTLPKQGKNVDAAWEFINWVTAPEQALAIFKEVGNLPAQPDIYNDPAFKAQKNPFFGDAPIGDIFAKTAQDLQPQYLGKKNGAVRVAVEAELTKVQQGKVDADKGWEAAKAAAEKAAR